MASRQRQDQILAETVQKLPHGEQIEKRSGSYWNSTETTSWRVDRDKIRFLLEQYRNYLTASRQRKDQILTGTVQKLPHGEQIDKTRFLLEQYRNYLTASRQRQDQILTETVQKLPHGEQIETRSDSYWNSTETTSWRVDRDKIRFLLEQYRTETTSRRVDRDNIRFLLEQYRNYLTASRQRQDQILTGTVQKLPHGEQIETRSCSYWNSTEITSWRRQDQILAGTVQKLPHGEQIETRSDSYWNSTETTSWRVDRDKIRFLLEQYRNMTSVNISRKYFIKCVGCRLPGRIDM